MKAVYKYILKETSQLIKLPLNTKILSAKNVNDDIVIYALVQTNDDITMNDYHFRIMETGQQDSYIENYKFLDSVTFKGYGKDLVYHIFFRGE